MATPVTCPVCGVQTDSGRDFCARCNADLRPVAAAAPKTLPISAPTPAGDPVVRAVALVIDGLIYVVLLFVALAFATWVARDRGGRGLTVITERLSWLHVVLALGVLGVYVAGSRLIAGQTPGTALVNRLAGSRAPTRRPAISALVPALLVALLVSFLVGRAVPVGATESPSGSGGGTAVSPQPSFSPPAPQPSPTVDPQTQAVAVDQVLHSSTASRAKLKAALTTLDGCHDAAAAATDLTEVASERSAQLSQASVLVLDQLPGGTEIRAALVEALTHSVAADQDFVAWGQQVAAGHCGHDANYQAGLDASKTAQDAKKRFCAAWNPVAATYGLPQRTQADI